MDDERVGGGALLRAEDLGYGLGVSCVGAEAVDGFRGESDKLAGGDGDGGTQNLLGIRVGLVDRQDLSQEWEIAHGD